MKILKYTYGNEHHYVRDVTLNKDGERKKYMVWYLGIVGF